jgi:hypothetical protein
MKKASILLTTCLPVWLLAGCTLVFAEGDPEPEPKRQVNTPTAGTHQGGAGSPSNGGGGESSDGGTGATVLPSAGAGGDGEGGTPSEVPAGGHGGAAPGASGLGMACADETTCPEATPECPAAAGICTLYCDEAWVEGWRAVDEKVAKCEALGGECTPIGEERSYCVP